MGRRRGGKRGGEGRGQQEHRRHQQQQQQRDTNLKNLALVLWPGEGVVDPEPDIGLLGFTPFKNDEGGLVVHLVTVVLGDEFGLELVIGMAHIHIKEGISHHLHLRLRKGHPLHRGPFVSEQLQREEVRRPRAMAGMGGIFPSLEPRHTGRSCCGARA